MDDPSQMARAIFLVDAKDVVSLYYYKSIGCENTKSPLEFSLSYCIMDYTFCKVKMYLHRDQEDKLKRLAQHFKTVLVVGARQVGKSTLLSHCFPTLQHITFDGLTDDYGAKADPTLFLNNFPPPIILDEIQYCPQLLAPIKRYVDEKDQKGLYLFTGSQNVNTLKDAAESMAGRVGIMQLDALSFGEIAQQPQHFLDCYLNDPETLVRDYVGHLPLDKTLYEMIWHGGMPDVTRLGQEDVGDYFSSYMQTYIERDVRLLENIQDLSAFERFVRLTSALTSQEINHTQLGREIGITRITAQKWLGILNHTYQWHELPPFHGNAIKRVTKRSKGYIHDSGMACYLQRISSPEALAGHPMLGALFESFVSMNILKMMKSIQTPPYAYHWRTAGGAEVDIVLERDGKLFPIEIKCKSQLTKRDARGLQAFVQTYPQLKVMPGVILYAGNECHQLTEDIYAVPWNAVFRNPKRLK